MMRRQKELFGEFARLNFMWPLRWGFFFARRRKGAEYLIRSADYGIIKINKQTRKEVVVMPRATDGLIGISVYLTKDEHKLVQKLAEEELRSLSAMAKFLLMREIRKRGITLDEPEVRSGDGQKISIVEGGKKE